MTRDPHQPLPGSEDEERRYLAIGGLDPTDASVAGVLLDALADPSWRVRHVAAGRLAGADPARVVPLLVAALGMDSTPARRNAAAAALSQIGPAAVPALVAALGSTVAVFRTAAVEVLGEIGDQRAAEPLARVLDDADVNARVAAAEALGKLGGSASVAALHRALEGSPDTAVARGVLEALAALQAPPPVDRLGALAEKPELLRPVLRLAGFVEEPAAFDLLARGLSALSRSAREAALQGVGEQRLHGRLPAGAARSAIEATVPPVLTLAAALAVDADDAALRAGALTVLQLARIPGDVHAIAAAAEDDRVRHVVVEVLEAMGPASADALAEALPSLAPVPQVVVLSTLARWRDERGFAGLVAALDADDPAARGLAIEALGQLADARPVPALLQLLSSDDRIASSRALTALLALAGAGLRDAVLDGCRGDPAPGAGAYRLLAQLGEEDDVGSVRRGLGSPLRLVRAAAAHAAGGMAGRVGAIGEAIPELLVAADDDDAGVRAAANQALGVVEAAGGGHARSAEVRLVLARGLGDAEAPVRAAAALALADCGARDHAAAIAGLAQDPGGPGVAAAAAVRALARLGALDLATLSAAARHADAEVVKQAVLASAPLNDPAATRLLLGAATHPRWDVRRAVALALATHPVPSASDELRKLAQSERDPLVLEAIGASLYLREGWT